MTAPKFCLTAFWNWRSNVPGAAGKKGPGAAPRPLWAGPSLFGQKGAVKLRRLFAFVKGKGRPVVPAVSAGTLPSECFVSNMDAPGSVALNGLFLSKRRSLAFSAGNEGSSKTEKIGAHRLFGDDA